MSDSGLKVKQLVVRNAALGAAQLRKDPHRFDASSDEWENGARHFLVVELPNEDAPWMRVLGPDNVWWVRHDWFVPATPPKEDSESESRTAERKE